MQHALEFIVFLAFVFAAIAFISPSLPVGMQIAQPFDFIWFGGGLVVTTAACVITTGIPCAVVITVVSLASIVNYIVLAGNWITLMVFMPLTAGMLYVILNLARGTK